MNFKYITVIVFLLMSLALARGFVVQYHDFLTFDRVVVSAAAPGVGVVGSAAAALVLCRRTRCPYEHEERAEREVASDVPHPSERKCRSGRRRLSTGCAP